MVHIVAGAASAWFIWIVNLYNFWCRTGRGRTFRRQMTTGSGWNLQPSNPASYLTLVMIRFIVKASIGLETWTDVK